MNDTFIWVGSQEMVINGKIDYVCMCSRAGHEAEEEGKGKGEERGQNHVEYKDSINNSDDVDRAEQRKDCNFL